MQTKRYLGDGVYADYDGYQIKLTAENNNQTNVIYLDHHVQSALVRYIDDLKKARNEDEQTEEG